MGLYSIYLIATSSLFAAAVLRSCVGCRSFRHAWILLLTDKLYSIISFNAYVATGIALSDLYISRFVSKLTDDAKERIRKKVSDLITELFFSILILNSSIKLSEIIIVPLMLFIEYIAITFSEELSSVVMGEKMFKMNNHERIFLGQKLLCLISFAVCIVYYIWFMKTINVSYGLFMMIQLILQFIRIISGIIRNAIFISEKKDKVKFQTSYFRKLLNASICNMIHFNINILFFLNQIKKSFKFPLYMVRSILNSIILIFHDVYSLGLLYKLNKILNKNIPLTTDSDINEDSTCIICKTKIIAGDSIKLPCNHCYHLGCLEKWLYLHSKCPICQFDLNPILSGPPHNIEEIPIPDPLEQVQLRNELLNLAKQHMSQEPHFSDTPSSDDASTLTKSEQLHKIIDEISKCESEIEKIQCEIARRARDSE